MIFRQISTLYDFFRRKIKPVLFRREVVSFINFYVFTIINSLIGIISISYLTKHLTPESYGMIGIFTSILFFVPSIMSFSVNGLQAIQIVDLDSEAYLKFRNSYITFILLSSIVCFILAIGTGMLLSTYGFVIITATILGFVQTLASIHSAELIQHSKSVQFGLLSAGTSVLSFVCTIVFISLFDMDWHSRIIALIIGDLVILILRFYVFSSIGSVFRFSFDQHQFKLMLLYGAPLLLSVVAGWILNQSDRYFLLHYFSLKEVGYYSAAAGVASFLTTINANMIKVIYPMVYQKLSNREGRSFISKLTIIYSAIIFVITLCFVGAIYFFGHLFLGAKYLSALPIIYILCFAQAFFGTYMTTGLVINYFKKNVIKTVLEFVCAGSVITISFLLITRIGIYAPAISLLSSYLLLSVLSFFISKKILNTQNVY